jgi:ubiquinone/menaquinone biosynthesis C-methylase UbiE
MARGVVLRLITNAQDHAETSNETERIRALYEQDARRYDRSMAFFERLLFKDARRWVCSRSQGEVLEIAIGTGLNLPFYPRDVRLTGLELSPAMLDRALARAHELGRDAQLQVGDATALPFPDQSFDTVVCTFALCTIPDEGAAVAEARRVLRPGGRFVFAEHVRSPVRAIRIGQRVLDPLMVRFQGDHLLREPLNHLRANDFTVETLERYSLGITERGVARVES